MGTASSRDVRAYAQVTADCDAACAHCGFSCGEREGGVLGVATLERYMDALAGEGLRLRQLALTGGEPMLSAHRVYALAAAARDRGVQVRLITHAGWATDGPAACRQMARLAAAGVSGLWIGAGHFHDERIPRERTRFAVEAALARGLAVHLNHVYLHPLTTGMRGKGLCEVDARIPADAATHLTHAAWQAEAGGLLSSGWARLWDRGRGSKLIDDLGPALAAELRRDLKRAEGEGPLPALLGLSWDGRRFDNWEES